MLKNVAFHRFKQFKKSTFKLRSNGVTLVAGGNNSGKTSLLHGLAVWQFCKTAIEMERGNKAFVQGSNAQGLGLGDDEFSPLALPNLKHLWTNLRPSKESEPDGYTLQIECGWETPVQPLHLRFGLSLTNDRLFIKALSSNLTGNEHIPRIAYLPPFAGITDRETRIPVAIRTRRIGEGLAGAVLRNVLLDMHQKNMGIRQKYREGRTKIRDVDLRTLRQTDAWELLQEALRETFSCELEIEDFRDEYHSYIKVNVLKGTREKYRIQKHPGYNTRDLMVEGSGFLQWLSVYSLAVNPDVDVLLLDEPDAHLHVSLQEHLFSTLDKLARANGKQVLIATHSAEILRNANPADIFEIRDSEGEYLAFDEQKISLLSGLGSSYAPRIDRIKKTNRVLFLEGKSDLTILQSIAKSLGRSWSTEWIEWIEPTDHKIRQYLFRALKKEMPDLKAISLRDRDSDEKATVGEDLREKGFKCDADFSALKWRRRNIESYLIWPPAIARASGLSEDEVRERLSEDFALAIPTQERFIGKTPADILMDIDGKKILTIGSTPLFKQISASAYDVAAALKAEEVCEDFKTLFDHLDALR